MKIKVFIIGLLLLQVVQISNAQMPSVPVRQQPQTTPRPVATPTPAPAAEIPIKPAVQEDNTWFYVTLLVLIAGLCGAIYWSLNNKKQEREDVEKLAAKNKKAKNDESVDADRELEWLRKNQQLIDKRKNRSAKVANASGHGLPNSKVFSQNGFVKEVQVNVDIKNVQLTSGMDLPVYQIENLGEPSPYPPLSYSDDEALLGAIEQTHDEDEEDELVRDLAVKILAMFRNRNSVEALTQVALYDLSSSLRVKALMTLSEFDHESVFEPILLACADPTREVRAAAARCLTKLGFNRGDAWARIAVLKDSWRTKQMAKAAIESGLVERSFDRLVHNDYKHVYEAFALIALLITSDETELVIDKLENHSDPNVRLALLHVIKILDAKNLLPDLYRIATLPNLPHEFSDALESAIQKVGDLQMVA